jgi:hypothetical protein
MGHAHAARIMPRMDGTRIPGPGPIAAAQSTLERAARSLDVFATLTGPVVAAA